jgi:transposase-like protein
VPHTDPADPPRRRGNKRPGRGTRALDRPPVVGVVGRASGRVRLTVVGDTRRATVQPVVERATRPTATVYTDDWVAYGGLAATGRGHAAVRHTPGRREWARDDDGDGVREVHTNTIEGLWTGLRNFLRPFRGVSQRYLAGYAAVFSWAHNLKAVSGVFVRRLLGIRLATDFPT